MSALVEFMKAAIAKFPTQEQLADEIGIDPSRFSRVKRVDAGAFNALNCLRLAQILGVPPGEILRAAGKDALADLLDALYGPDAHAAMRVDDEEIAARWKALTDAQREAVRNVLRVLTPAVARPTRQPEKQKNASRKAARQGR